MSLSSTIGKIWTGAKTAWVDIEAEIDADAKAIKGVLPSSSLPAFNAVVSDLKQDASDAISAADTALAVAIPGVVRSAEALLDGALATYTNGAALPLVPATNKAVEDIASAAKALADSWALKAKAALAANNAAAAAPQPQTPQPQTQSDAPLSGQLTPAGG